MGLGLCRTCLAIKLDEGPPPISLLPTEDPSKGLGLRFSVEVIAVVLDIDVSLR
jgi:hypothetical protein